MAIFDSSKSNWSVGARSETGYIRDENQDRMAWIRAPIGDVFVVSDGAGGHAGGGVAATLTVDVLQRKLATLDAASVVPQIAQAFEAANEAVYRSAHSGDAATWLMCATAVLLIVAPSRMMVAHVGDSRAYLYTRPHKLRRLTKDHSQVQRLLDEGLVTPEQAVDHPSSSVLERAIGYQPTVTVDISNWLPLNPDETILLCSDGLCGYVTDEHIAEVLAHDIVPQRIADQLVALALARGGEDNVTVQVIRYGKRTQRAQNWHAPVGILCLLAVIAAVSAGLAGLIPQLPSAVMAPKAPATPSSLQSSITTQTNPPVVPSAAATPDANTSPAVVANASAASSTQASTPASTQATKQASTQASEPAPARHAANSRHPAKASASSASAAAHRSHVRKRTAAASAVSSTGDAAPEEARE
jgi:serine/threonine protein phosphatase PrpC